MNVCVTHTDHGILGFFPIFLVECWGGGCIKHCVSYTVEPELVVTSFEQPTCLKHPNKMFPNVNFVLIFTSVKQTPALSSHFSRFPCEAA